MISEFRIDDRISWTHQCGAKMGGVVTAFRGRLLSVRVCGGQPGRRVVLEPARCRLVERPKPPRKAMLAGAGASP